MERLLWFAGKNVAEMPGMYEIPEFVGSVFRIPELSFFIRILMLRWHLAWKTEAWKPEYIRERIENTVKELDIEKLLTRDVFFYVRW